MSETTAQRRSNAPLWVIAGLLLVVIVAAGIYLVHRHNVSAERDKYRSRAEYYCTLTGNAPADAGKDYLKSSAFERCVDDQIDVLVANDGELG